MWDIEILGDIMILGVTLIVAYVALLWCADRVVRRHQSK